MTELISVAPTTPVRGSDRAPLVQTRDLTKRYGKRLAVFGLSMTVRRGEVYGFLGPNGAGKTTTLRMLVGLIRPTSGTASIAGTSAGDLAVLALMLYAVGSSLVAWAVFRRRDVH